MMKRFLLFSGEWEGNGGWGDFKKDFDTLAEASEEGALSFNSAGSSPWGAAWWHVVDLETGTIAGSGDNVTYDNSDNQEAKPL